MTPPSMHIFPVRTRKGNWKNIEAKKGKTSSMIYKRLRQRIRVRQVRKGEAGKKRKAAR